MSKKVILLLAFLWINLHFSFGIACAEKGQAVYVMPLSLQEIEEEAFSGTAVETVVFPEGFLRIGEKAFDNAWCLRDVYIPETTEYIADSAFSITSNLTIHGVDGSYAKDWAYKHEIPFIIDNIWYITAQSKRPYTIRTEPISRCIATIVLIVLFKSLRLGYYGLRSRRPQDRPELNHINYRFP